MSIKVWLEATRPKTLAAGIIPVIIGSSVAYFDNSLNIIFAIITLICSGFIQIITNFFNEVYDFKRGADGIDRIGPQRQVASGLISIKTMLIVTYSLLIITFTLGLILVNYAGWNILVVGILSMLFSYLYTGGPYPLAYKGLGDIFVFIFFGIVAVNGSYYVQTGQLSQLAIIASFAPGLLSANILNVNNIRDIDTDAKAGKITLAYRLGRTNAIRMYITSTIICYILPIFISIKMKNLVFLLPLMSLPLGMKLCMDLYNKSGKQLNKVLAITGVLLLIYGILNSLSFILAK